MVGFFFFFFFVIVSIVIIIMLRRNAGYLQSCTVDRNIQKSSDFLSPLARTQETFSSSMTSPNTIWKIKLSSTISSKSETKHMLSIDRFFSQSPSFVTCSIFYCHNICWLTGYTAGGNLSVDKLYKLQVIRTFETLEQNFNRIQNICSH